jgi:recombination protein RecA
MAASSLATLRSKLEADLRGRIASPFAYRDRNTFELVSTGIPEMDALVGGLPRGAMTEICGAACSGRTSLLLSALASRTSAGEVCALVDARDSFDPLTGNAAGIDLKKLLWVRCQNIDQALRAMDLLIQSGGFGMVAVDLSDVPAKTVRQVPLNAWFRFRRAVEDTPTILLLLEQESNAKTCASLVLRLEAVEAKWAASSPRVPCSAGRSPRSPTALAQALMFTRRDEGPVPPEPAPHFFRSLPDYPFARLLRGFAVRGDVMRSRIQIPEQRVVNIRAGTQPKMVASSEIFATETIWRSR